MQRPLDLYALFRLRDTKLVGELNNIMSGKSSSVKKHEIESLRGMANALTVAGAGAKELDGYYFSYSIPGIGKEFDVLRISDSYVLNIELKFVNVGIKEISEQIIRNEYYLRSLGKEIFICTYVCSEDRFYTVDGNGELTVISVDSVMEAVNKTNDFYCGSPDRLFDPEDYIFSPLSDPMRFLEGRYFLTQHQENIERALMNLGGEGKARFAAISGGSGTGKTLLLYDMALKAAEKGRVCVISACGDNVESVKSTVKQFTVTDIDEYISMERSERACDMLFVDGAHLLPKEKIEFIIKEVRGNNGYCVFFTEVPAILCTVKRTESFWGKLKRLVGANRYQLTDKIRTDPVVSAFIYRLLDSDMLPSERRPLKYGDVFALYAATKAEADIIISRYAEKGYGCFIPNLKNKEAPGKGKRLIVLGKSFGYDGEGRLRANGAGSRGEELMEGLVYTGLKGIEGGLGILVIGNMPLFKKILEIFK